jgi:adenosine/AMP kinase
MVALPAFITLHGFKGMLVRINISTIQSYEENIIDSGEQKTLIGFIDGNSQTVIETPEQIDAMIKDLYPSGK